MFPEEERDIDRKPCRRSSGLFVWNENFGEVVGYWEWSYAREFSVRNCNKRYGLFYVYGFGDACELFCFEMIGHLWQGFQRLHHPSSCQGQLLAHTRGQPALSPSQVRVICQRPLPVSEGILGFQGAPQWVFETILIICALAWPSVSSPYDCRDVAANRRYPSNLKDVPLYGKASLLVPISVVGYLSTPSTQGVMICQLLRSCPLVHAVGSSWSKGKKASVRYFNFTVACRLRLLFLIAWLNSISFFTVSSFDSDSDLLATCHLSTIFYIKKPMSLMTSVVCIWVFNATWQSDTTRVELITL